MTPHHHQGSVAFHETDAAGIVHFSNYFRFAEEAETAALASLGIFSEHSLQRYAFPRVQASAQYSQPLRFAAAYTVQTTLTSIGRSSLHWHFDIIQNGQSCAVVEYTTSRRHCADGSAAPYTPEETKALNTLLQQPSQHLGGTAVPNAD